MRWTVVLVVLLAGCSSSGFTQDGPEAPLAGSRDVPAGDDGTPDTAEDRRVKPKFTMSESGSMSEGVDRSWKFELAPNATQISIKISTVPVQAMTMTLGLTAEAFHNGTRAAYWGGGFNFCTCGHTLIDIHESEPEQGLLTHYAGAWELRLRGDRQWGGYEMAVTVVY